ncbi:MULTISPECIES: hypothetical protein [Pseudomonas]|jgi:hypothetical protein|nr:MULTISPECIES: hypothetical protein [Pseudomonas]MDI3205323.1 hypothetical protein [Pseudomonas shahriarae]MDZ4300220.1 hypothetical protein [Pseudomonas sp.]WLH55198.1 hypothetical protein PSH73_14775 [Pseudomonas sp. FP2294]WLI32618.1 hypothetical protein PSH80_15200 [Pseudomonas sp. FP818]
MFINAEAANNRWPPSSFIEAVRQMLRQGMQFAAIASFPDQPVLL